MKKKEPPSLPVHHSGSRLLSGRQAVRLMPWVLAPCEFSGAGAGPRGTELTLMAALRITRG